MVLVISGLAAAAGIILAVAVIKHLSPGTPPVVTPVALLESVVGELEISPADGIPLRVGPDRRGMGLSTGTLLEAGPGDRAAVRLTGGQSLRLDSSTRLLLVTAEVMRLGIWRDLCRFRGPGEQQGRNSDYLRYCAGHRYSV